MHRSRIGEDKFVVSLMNRRTFFLLSMAGLVAPARQRLSGRVITLIGTGVAGRAENNEAATTARLDNPFGVLIGPDGALWFCEYGNHRVLRLDLRSKTIALIAGNGEAAYKGDSGPATEASLNRPHEIRIDRRGNIFIAERDNHVIRKIDGKTKRISTLAGTGQAGFSGDGGPAEKAQLRQPHSIAFGPDGSLLICDIGNHRIRRVDLKTGMIDTFSGTGEQLPTPEAASVRGTPLNGPRSIDVGPDGTIYLVLREGNTVVAIDPKTRRFRRLAGTGKTGYTGDGGPAREATFSGPKGIAYAPDGLFISDTENHVIRRVELKSGVIKTVLGTGQRGDGPDGDPLMCKLSRPHGIFSHKGTLYVGDSETHRVRVLLSA
jgi:DNA-binding beta-propeller fold protein YncE